NDVVRIVQVELVYVGLWDELIDIDHAFALQCDGLELLRFQLDVIALADLVSLDDVVRFDLASGFGIYFFVLDPVAGLLMDLVKADLFALRGGGKQRDRTRDERQLEVAFPVRTRSHGTHSILGGTRTQRDR